MLPERRNDINASRCPDCGGTVTSFEHMSSGRDLGYHLINQIHQFAGAVYNRFIYRLYRCAGCGRGGMDAESNWVSTSMFRNRVKSNWTLEELGWNLVPPVRSLNGMGSWHGSSASWRISRTIKKTHTSDGGSVHAKLG
jgi:hypothetical protein